MPAGLSDFNNDGIEDYLALDWLDNTAQVQLGNSDGTYTAGPTFPTQQSWTGAEAAGDFNGDGNLDLVLGGLTADYAGEVRAFLGNGDGSFQSAGSVPLPDGYSGGAQETCDIEVVDLLKNPALAGGDQILALPTLVRRLPPPTRKIIGDLANEHRVLVGLDLRKPETALKYNMSETK